MHVLRTRRCILMRIGERRLFGPPKRLLRVQLAQTMECSAVPWVLVGGEAYAWVLTEVRE